MKRLQSSENLCLVYASVKNLPFSEMRYFETSTETRRVEYELVGIYTAKLLKTFSLHKMRIETPN